MTSRQLTLIAASLATALGAAPAANGQGQDDSIFEEITVTAKKREESIYEVPVAMSAFSDATIAKQGITDLVDIGKFVPNLNVTTFSAGHTASANPFIRGIGLQDHLITTDPGVSVYVDGVYLGRQVGQNWSLSNIERIEVLRGPQGTLYGRNSLGGSINIITKRPGTYDGAKVGLTVGTEGRLNGEFYGDTSLTDTLAVSVNGAFKRRGGSGKFLNIPNAEKDVGELQDVSARAALLWTPTDRFSIVVAADGNEGDNGMNPYTTLIDEVPNGAVFGAGYRNSDVAANPYDNNTGQVDQVNVRNQAYGVSVTADYAMSDALNLRLIASDRHSDYRAGLDDDSFIDNFLTFPEIGYADQTSIELQVNGEYERWDFVAGIYSFDEEGKNSQDPNVFLGGAGDFLLGQDVSSTAIYGNVGFQVSDALRVSGGLRFTDDEKDATININSGLIDTGASDDWSETSWELAATFELSDDLNVYGTVQNGYQSGQFPPRPFCLFNFLDFSQPGNVSQPNCFVANDNITAINYEAGIKGTPLDTLQMSVAIFYTDYSDLPYQVSTTQGAGFDTRNIIVDQTSVGLEWESIWAITNDFLLHTSLGYIDVDVDDPEAVAPLTPELTISISPEYSIPMVNGAEIVLRADWSYRDEMYGEPSADPGRFTQIDSRDILNFDFAYHSPDQDWTVALYGRNVTDERYDNGRLNTGDYILRILSNDIREFGVRFVKEFTGN
ncbi:MAG: TonB-dependent receptor [Gammaproteobacteria bacterium]|nr:TonB-dependent receptor [Gammaproteobacteria bacterium]MDH5309046.1 TonB-dependent receptor [Gammaproteobacteria bacterium]